MDVQQAQEIVARGKRESADLEEAQEIVRAEKNRLAAERAAEQAERKRQEQIAEGQEFLKAVRAALNAFDKIDEGTLARWGASAYQPAEARGSALVIPATHVLPLALRRAVEHARERLEELKSQQS